ncbi:Rad2 nuclease [Bulinus truncatus]|nr:Rad2 nuclease [Bulinus truncatus]
MGITGLIPFLKKIHKPINIAEYQGCTVAIDAYCWLHKGAFSCAEKLALGETTEQYVYYCMKYINYMLKNNLKPILVFDGCHLKSKSDVEKARREKRELHRKKAAQYLREGKRAEAKECLQRCVDITPQMALQLMNACRKKGVDCIVAPYEADAQLAYLNLKGIAQIVVTEDSDLLLFGCDKVIFKMDFFGNGTLIEKSRLNEVLSIQNGIYTFEKFRHMCILSGCDYLPSLPGIGLNKACKVFKTARQSDLTQLLKKLSTYLKMNLTVPDDYVEGFIRADNTFLYQLVFDPLTRKLCPLNPYPPEINPKELDYAGQYLPPDLAFQIAIGNVDIHDHKCIAYFDPDTFKPPIAEKIEFLHQLSIWNKNYRVKGSSPSKPLQEQRPSLHDKVQTVKTEIFKRSPKKRKLDISEAQNSKLNKEMLSEYGFNENVSPSATKKLKPNTEVDNTMLNVEQSPQDKCIDEKVALPSTPCKCDISENSSLDTSTCESQKGESITAANIGDEMFKSSDKAVENTVLTPTKGRNIFAKSDTTAEKHKFSLGSCAEGLQSRYFSNNNQSQISSQSKKPPKVSSTQLQKKSSIQTGFNQLFKSAVKLRKEKGDNTQQNCLSSHSSEDEVFMSARDSFECVKNDLAISQHDKSLNQEKDNKTSQLSSKDSSIFQKFQSRYFKENNKTKVSPSSSAFSWSQKKINVQSNITTSVKHIKPKCSMSNEEAHFSNVVQNSRKLAVDTFRKMPSLDKINIQNTTQMGDQVEVVMLKSQSYDEYLKSMVSADLLQSKCSIDQSETVCLDLFTTALDESDSAAAEDQLNESSSADSCQQNVQDLSCQRNKVITDNVEFPADVIDLTHDDQVVTKTSKIIVKSGSSSCRVSGLSRKKKEFKSKNKTTAKNPKQISIKEIMCKFQYSKTSENKSVLQESVQLKSTYDDKDDCNSEDCDATPTSNIDPVIVGKVQRKLCL